MSFGELVVRRVLEIGVRHRPQQHLVPDLRRAPVLGHQTDHSRHVAAYAVAGYGETLAVDVELLAVFGDPFGRSVGLKDGSRIARLG